MEFQPLTQEQADAIGTILRAEYESNTAFREIVNAKAAALEAACPAMRSNQKRSSVPSPASARAQGVAA